MSFRVKPLDLGREVLVDGLAADLERGGELPMFEAEGAREHVKSLDLFDPAEPRIDLVDLGLERCP